jgi:large subunit ribosomal protein L10
MGLNILPRANVLITFNLAHRLWWVFLYLKKKRNLMPNNINKEIVAILKDKLSKAKSVVFTDYIGIKSKDANLLRQKMKENDAEMLVAKNTLLKVAISEQKNAGMTKAEKDLEGSTAAILSYSDPITPIKAFFEFTKTLEFPKVKSAVIEDAYFTAEQVDAIKTIPSKEQLLTQIVVAMNSPLSGFANVLSGVQRKFVYVINAISKSKGGVN